jgi:putative membrane protein
MFRSMSRILVLALLSIVVAAPQLLAQQHEKKVFADQLTGLGNFLLQSAELARSRGQEESVRSFAETIFQTQQPFMATLQESVDQEGLQASPELSQEYQAKLQALQTAEQNQFDNAYFSAQVVALESMIQLMQGYQEGGEAGALKTFAANQIGGLRTLYVRAEEFSVP